VDAARRFAVAVTDTDTDTQVYGTAALIRFTNDAVFVARFQGGWKVTAAGCTRIPQRPLDEAPSAYEHFQKM